MSSRRSSLFALEHPFLDHGVAVVCHADHPKREHSNNSLLNTGQTIAEKEEDSSFNDDIVRHLMREVFEYHLKGIEYRKKESDELCKQIVDDLRKKVAVLDYKGYKMICSCVMSSSSKPPLWLESSCTWHEEMTNVEKDRFVELVFKNKEFYAIGTVFGIYDEENFKRNQRECLFEKD